MIAFFKKNRQKLFVLLTATAQLITPAFTKFEKTSTFNQPEIIPAGYTFSIWGVITLLAFSYGVYQLLPNRKNKALHNRLGRALILIYSLFSAWLFAADREWLMITLVIFICMLGLLSLAFSETLLKRNNFTFVEKIILEGQLALYTGWSTVAVFANLAALLRRYNIIVSYSTIGILLQLGILLLAFWYSLLCISKFKFNYAYVSTIVWAFTGIYFGLVAKNGATALKIFVIAAIAMMLLIVLREKLKENVRLRLKKQGPAC